MRNKFYNTTRWRKLRSMFIKENPLCVECNGIGQVVDHIIPIKGLIDGRRVCGLHVPWNLQYLTPAQNRKKKNRISEADIHS